MSTWVIISWVLVAIMTAINVFLFLKLKGASEQMMKMAFPSAKNMNEAMAQMQGMLGGMQGRGGKPRMGGTMPRPAQGGKGGNANMDAQLKAAMDMLAKMNGGKR
jgi:hypothetical protein